MFDRQNTAAQSLAGAQSMITASKRGLWIGKLPESEDALYPCGYFLLGYGPVRCCPSGPCGALSQEKGRMSTGVPGHVGRKGGSWTDCSALVAADLFHATASVTCWVWWFLANPKQWDKEAPDTENVSP